MSSEILTLTHQFLHQEVETMTAHQYDELLEVVKFHNEQYYLHSKPLITDQEYDQIFALLKSYEELYPQYLRDDSPTQRLVGQLQESFNQAKHKAQMLSLENTYNATDLEDTHKSLARILNKQEIIERSYTIEPKFDGLSIELIYEEGNFVQAITRGDGLVGEDITLNVKMISSVPMKLQGDVPQLLSLRGEIVMPKSMLEQINQERVQSGQEPFVNVRNAAAGSVKQLDTAITAKRGLQVRVYEILDASKEYDLPSMHDQVLRQLKNRGLPVYERCTVKTTMQEVINVCENPDTKFFLDQQDIEFDGLVIKLQNYDLRQLLGTTNHHPKRAVAYKFPAQQVMTVLESVDFQVGRSGVITPAGNLKPIKLSGATISRVSLHNFDMIAQKDIRIGDTLWIQRSGEVIPYVVAVAKQYRTGKEQSILPPAQCPVCHTSTVHEQDSPFYKCPNIQCPARIKQSLIYFVSRDAMNIEGLGDALIELFVDQGIIKNYDDLYTLDDPTKKLLIISLPGVGEKTYTEILKQISLSKGNPLRRRINARGIEGIGKKMAKVLEQELYKTYGESLNVEQMLQAFQDQPWLEAIYGIGKETIHSLTKWASDPQVKSMLIRLQKSGWTLSRQQSSGSHGMLQGVHFSVTGSFDLPRPVIVSWLEQQGGVFDTEPSKATARVLVGEKAGSKLTKAQSYGCKIYQSFEELYHIYPGLKDTLPQVAKESKPQSVGLFG